MALSGAPLSLKLEEPYLVQSPGTLPSSGQWSCRFGLNGVATVMASHLPRRREDAAALGLDMACKGQDQVEGAAAQMMPTTWGRPTAPQPPAPAASGTESWTWAGGGGQKGSC